MKTGLYSICDVVAQEYGEPFMAKNDDIARRCFHLGLSKADPSVKKDYMLYQIGEFDTETGHITENMPVYVRETLEVVEDESK